MIFVIYFCNVVMNGFQMGKSSCVFICNNFGNVDFFVYYFGNYIDNYIFFYCFRVVYNYDNNRY